MAVLYDMACVGPLCSHAVAISDKEQQQRFAEKASFIRRASLSLDVCHVRVEAIPYDFVESI